MEPHQKKVPARCGTAVKAAVAPGSHTRIVNDMMHRDARPFAW
jgi:hypothetical protein